MIKVYKEDESTKPFEFIGPIKKNYANRAI